MKKVLILALLVSFGLSSCKSTQQSGRKEARQVGDKKTQFILSEIEKNEANGPETLNFRANTEVIKAGKNTSFKTSVRMVQDSVIWMSITAYSYEVARVLATPDSIKYVSRTDKKYFIGGYDFIENKIGVDFSFDDLQSLILAHSFGLENPEKINKRNSKNSYVLSSINKRKLKKMQKGKELYPDDIEVLYTNWVNPETFQVEKVSLVDVSSQHQASIQYLTFENLEQYEVLSSFKMDIIAKEKIEISSAFSKFQVNEPLKFPFKISSKYEQIVQ